MHRYGFRMNNPLEIKKKTSELTVDDIAVYCEKNGITIESLCLKLNQLLNATRDKYDKYGDFDRAEPDNNVQLKALGVALELLRLVNNKTVEVSGTIVHKAVPAEDIIKVETVFNNMMELRRRRDLDRIQQGVVMDANYTAIPGQ